MFRSVALDGGEAVSVGSARRYLGLVATLAEREFVGAYRGNLTGALASFVVPLLMLATYAFVFSVLIPIRVRPGQSSSDYGYFLFAGLIAWNLFADVAARAPRLFVDSPNYVHRPQFPVSTLVAAPCLASFYRAVPWVGAFVLARWLFVEPPAATTLLVPFALFWTALLALMVSLVLASLGALIRDSADIAPAGMTLLFFLTPVLYAPDRLAEVSIWLIRLNPVAQPVAIVRGLIFDGVLPAPDALLATFVSAFVWALLAFLSYRITRPLLQDLV